MIGVSELVVLGMVAAVLASIVYGIVWAARRVAGSGAIVRCLACGGVVSLRTAACPHCGAPKS